MHSIRRAVARRWPPRPARGAALSHDEARLAVAAREVGLAPAEYWALQHLSRELEWRGFGTRYVPGWKPLPTASAFGIDPAVVTALVRRGALARGPGDEVAITPRGLELMPWATTPVDVFVLELCHDAWTQALDAARDAVALRQHLYARARDWLQARGRLPADVRHLAALRADLTELMTSAVSIAARAVAMLQTYRAAEDRRKRLAAVAAHKLVAGRL